MAEEQGVSVRGRHVFLSGPMSGISHYNVAAFADAHATVIEHGATHVYNPANEYLIRGMNDMVHEYWMRKCLQALIGDVPHYDVLVSLPGWEDSEGARTEREVAQACGIKCVDLSEIADGE